MSSQEEIQQKIVNESAQLALEKYNIEERSSYIKKRLNELSIALNTLTNAEKLSKDDVHPQGPDK